MNCRTYLTNPICALRRTVILLSKLAQVVQEAPVLVRRRGTSEPEDTTMNLTSTASSQRNQQCGTPQSAPQFTVMDGGRRAQTSLLRTIPALALAITALTSQPVQAQDVLLQAGKYTSLPAPNSGAAMAGLLVEDQTYPLSLTLTSSPGNTSTWNGRIEVKVTQFLVISGWYNNPFTHQQMPIIVHGPCTYYYQVTSAASNPAGAVLYGVQVFTQSRAAQQTQYAGYLPGTNQIPPTWAVNNYGGAFELPQAGTYFGGFGGGGLGGVGSGLKPGQQTNWFYLATDDANYTSGTTGDTLYFDFYWRDSGKQAPSISSVWCPN
jgi:hypothetical protein